LPRMAEYPLALFLDCFIIRVLQVINHFHMSKRNKQKNHYKFQSANQEAEQTPKDAVVESEASDSHFDTQAPQDNAETSTEASSTSASVDIPVEVVPEEKPAQTVTVASPVVAGQQKSQKIARAFVWGLLVGAVIVAILF